MKALFFVLNEVTKLEKLLSALSKAGVGGGTILNSTGMAHQLVNDDIEGMFGGLRRLFDPSRKESKTLFFIVKDENVQLIINIIKEVVGPLDVPNSGIVFTIPIDYVEGLKF